MPQDSSRPPLRPWDPATFQKMADFAERAGFEVADKEKLLAETNGTGHHWKLLTRVADMDGEPWPALAARRITVACDYCQEICWYDPLASVYPPGEVLVCITCFIDPRSEEVFKAGPPDPATLGRLPLNSPLWRQ